MKRILILVCAILVLVEMQPSGLAQCCGVGYWRFDEGFGSLAADSLGGHDGTLAVAPNDPTWITGMIGSALHFDGDDFVRIPNSTALEPRTVSVEAWLRSKVPYASQEVNPQGIAYILAKGAYGCSNASYALYTGASGGLYFYVASSRRFILSPDAGTGIWDGQWHHVAGTFDGSTVRLYVDGVEVGTGSHVSPGEDILYRLITDNDLYIGTYPRYGGCNLSFVGDIDEVRVWSCALSRYDIAESANRLPK